MINYNLFYSLLQKKKKKGLIISGWFVIIMAFLLVIGIIVLFKLVDINVTSSVVGDHLNMQYSTDSGRELYSILASGCSDITEDAKYENKYKGYNVENLISVYVSGDLRVKQALDAELRACIDESLKMIADVNEGKDRVGLPIKHYMYFYVIYGGNKYLEGRQPDLFFDADVGMAYIPWNPEFVTISPPGKDTAMSYSPTYLLTHSTTLSANPIQFQFPVNPRYFSKTMNDMFSVQVPLADSGNMQFDSAKAVLEEWSDEPWTTLTQSQQEYSGDYEN